MGFVLLKQVCLLMVLICSSRVVTAVNDAAMLRFDPTYLSVLEGNSGTLTCNISNSEFGVYYILWNNTRSFVFHPQDNCRTTGPLTNTQEYNVRCINEDVQITILNMSRDRHGEVWTCQRNMLNKSYESSSTFTVIVPITNVRLETQSEYSLTKENTPTKCVCVTSAGYPDATIRWYKNNKLLTNGDVTTSSTTSNTFLEVVRSTLTLYLTRADNSSQIHCTANNNGTMWLYSTKTSVIVYYAPDNPIIKQGTSQVQGDFKVKEGNAVNVICTTSSFPDPSYSWTTPKGVSINGRMLFITNISRTDGGQYTCEATNTMRISSGQTYEGRNTTTTRVLVLYPPRQLTVKYRNTSSNKQYEIRNTLLHVVRNDSFTLNCTADSKPPSTYRWTGHPHFQETNAYTLTVKSIQHDLNLTCTATNIMNETLGMTSTQSANTTIRIIVQYPPDAIHIRVNGKETTTYNNTARVVEGSNVTLSCDANSKPPPSKYTWSKVSSTTTTTREYNIVRINRTQAGQYTCIVEYVLQPSFKNPESGTISKQLSLEVLYPTKIDSFMVNGHTTGNVTVNEKDNITFVCNVDGKPESNVSILHVYTSLKHATVMNNVNHTVTNVTCTQHGQYACAANNMYNTERPTKYLTLFVRCSPRPKPYSELQKAFASTLNVDTTISFEVLAYPAPTDDGFKWEKEITHGSSWKDVKNNDNILVSSFGVKSNLTLKNVSRSSFGNYRFTVTNDVGTYTHQFVLKTEDKPQSPTNFHHVDELTTDSKLTFIWSPGFDGGAPQTFILRYKKTNSNDEWLVQRIPDNGRPEMNTTLESLTSSTMYDVYLIASNEIGNSSAVEITAVHTGAAPILKPSNRIIPAVSAVTASVLVICVIVVIFMLYKRRQNKMDSSEMHSATTTNVSRGVYENVCSERNDDANKDGTDTKSHIYQNVPDLHLPSSDTSSKQSSSVTQEAAAPVHSHIIYENLMLKAF